MRYPGWMRHRSHSAFYRPTFMRTALRDFFLFGIAFLAAAAFGRALSLGEQYYVTFWPPSGLFIAVLACSRPRRWPLFVASAALANVAFDLWVQHLPLQAALGFTLANVVEALLGAGLIQLAVGVELTLTRLRHLLIWTVAAGFVASAAGAAVGAAVVLAQFGGLSYPDFWMRWWVANASGVFVFGPLAWWLMRHGRALLSGAGSRRTLEAGLMVITVATLAEIIFSGVISGLYPFLLMPFFLWPAIRFSIPGVSVMTVLLATIVITNTLQGAGPFGDPQLPPLQAIMLAEVFSALYAFTFGVLAAIFEQSSEAEQALRVSNAELEARVKARTSELQSATTDLREQRDHLKKVSDDLRISEERFRVAQELSLFGFTIMRSVRSDSGDIVDFQWQYVNPAAVRILQRPAAELVGRRLLDVLPGNRDKSNLFEMYVQVVETGRSQDAEQYYDAEGIRGWFRTMTVKLGDGVAVSFTDVTHRKLLEEALRQRNEALMEADRRKDEFLATLAHELRNPLAPIRNSLEVMRLAGDNRSMLAEARSMMERQISQMVRLIDDLLDLSRISHNRLQLRREAVTLAAVVNSAVETSRPLIEERGHRLVVELPAETVWMHADLTRLAQVFVNLLNNSAKYTDSGGSISLRGHSSADEVAVTVEDNGIGIPPDMLPRIFDMFTQVDRTGDHSQGGLGIGLTLVRRLVELHGGRIEVDSVRGEGTRFTVRLPVAAAPGGAEGAPAPRQRSPGAARVKVLIVDDNRDSAGSLAAMLDLNGYETLTAYDGNQAIERAALFLPHAVLLDIGLPGRNGYEVAQHLRAQPWGREVLLVAVTGWGQEEDRRRSQEAGFDAHLVKPIDPGELERLLRERQPTRV
jgi:signal transduction histidine kinase/integral membrane sensor domain MASE1/ActR/RegA family two-component response regulator